MGFILILGGLLTAGLAYSDADWYFERPRTRMWSSILGSRENGRIAQIVMASL